MTIAKHLPDASTVRSVRQRLDRPLVLVGMMGVGKSTVGRKLAAALGMAFTDADDEIVAAANMPIRDIFDSFGEAYFRDGERRVIARLMEDAGSGSVIATGGGAFVTEETRAIILENAVAIWLNAETDTLVERVSRNDKRPLLEGGDTRELVATMQAAREPSYAQAHIHVASDTGPHHVAVRRIVEALDRWLP
ncbi:shikimate kinase [Erythrobacter arachoides]|uniref:Shikimate kinase n=1 Tax=Aurantiacibacter arachoides TaxID=1850444 RepID=A0A844ZYK7_9SPHN|nr:shikimate kinase [Aurantiacibacter arachoides]MXO92975.1 shikimate kinase [Aurantiacibacter arachoides]GGD53000.1 shikimate kinase [Aurantiacibacter arachoides]